MRSEKLTSFLTETKYCNFNHTEIKNLAQKIVKSCVSEREKIRIYEMVRKRKSAFI